MPDAQSLFDATVELARLWRNAAARCASTSGLTDAMTAFQPAGQLAARFGVAVGKQETFALLLDMLAEEGLVERRSGTPRAPAVYRRASGPIAVDLSGQLRKTTARRGVLAGWMHDSAAERAVTGATAFLGTDLGYLKRDGGQLTFSDRHNAYWQAHLSNPLYDLGRMLAVRALARPGGRYLDLAGGTGIGARRLAEFCDGSCDITIVDKSADFLRTARTAPYPPGTRAHAVHRDLNEGLPHLPAATFDGALCIGAFHYIQDKAARLREIHRLLRPGAPLVIGNCLSLDGYPDQSLATFTVSIVDETAHPIPTGELLSLLTDTGFEMDPNTVARGSSVTLTARKPDTPQLPHP
ncbi:class I SAM-dependent methyltransferase [Streptomyces sp. NPDC020096]